MAARFCIQCGSEIAEGKRFCSRCGAEVNQRPAPSAQPDPPSPIVAPAAPLAAVPATQPPSVPLERQPEPAPYATVPVVLPLISPDIAEQPAPQAWEPVESPGDIAAAATQPSQQRLWLAIGIAASVLLIAGLAFLVYRLHRKAPEPTAQAPAATASPTENLPQSAQSEDLPGPVPVRESPPATAAPEPPMSAPASISSELLKPAKRDDSPPARCSKEQVDSGMPGCSARPEKDSSDLAMAPPVPPVPAPIVREAPAKPARSTLRYAGPPIPPGGNVEFSGLPGGMLRFTFDHTLWQPRITHQGDGTQTLILHSLSSQVQTQCEVTWELAH